MRCTNTAAVVACDCRSLRFAADSIARMSSSAPSTGRSPGASTPPQAQQRAIEIAHRVDVPQAELLGDLGVAHRLGLANPMVARRGASAVCASMAMPGVHVTVVSKPGLSTASHGFGPANDRVAGSGGGINNGDTPRSQHHEVVTKNKKRKSQPCAYEAAHAHSTVRADYALCG